VLAAGRRAIRVELALLQRRGLACGGRLAQHEVGDVVVGREQVGRRPNQAVYDLGHFVVG